MTDSKREGNMFRFSKIKKRIVQQIIKTAVHSKPVRQVIDGLLYDTSKSTVLLMFRPKDSWENRFPGITSGVPTILFGTKQGRFFIQQHEYIYPCGEITAKHILGYDPEKYIEIFGKLEEA